MRSLSLVAVILLSSITPADDFFSENIEPALREHCYPCHSHASGKMKGGLTLDTRSGWASGGDSGPAIVIGNPAESLLISALKHESLEMPPDGKLDDSVIANFTRWVENGALDPRVQDLNTEPRDWWSLRPLVVPAIPMLIANRSAHPLDQFVVAKLAEHQLVPSVEAERRTLIRRLMFDLHGLPPTPAEVLAFEQDPRVDAYERLVDRLLASPRYGERWARHWMDTIHFADSHGYEHDVGREHAWPYRDYLIDAFNQDKPWTEFVKEQLAADIYFPDKPELTPALGFLGAGTFDLSTFTTAPVTFDYLDRDDLVTQTSAAFFSTTANCARCHDHKFDPISQEDYYALQAVFAGILKGDIKYDISADVKRHRARLMELALAAEQKLPDVLLAPEYQTLILDWLEDHATPVHWQPLALDTFISTEGATLSWQSAGYLLASGATPDKDTSIVTGTTTLKRVTAIRLDVLSHESLPMQGPGRCQNGNLHLSELELQVFEPQATEPRRVSIRQATADFDQVGWDISRAIDNNPATAWGIHPQVGQSHFAVFELSEPIDVTPVTKIVVTLKQLHGAAHLIGAFRLSVTDVAGFDASALPLLLEEAIAVEESQRSPEQRLAIAASALTQHVNKRLTELPEQRRVYAAGHAVEVPGGEGNYTYHNVITPKTVHLLRRGDFDKPQAIVGPGALSTLQHLPARFDAVDSSSEGARRAALANWIVHPENGLTWRSVVNRTWAYHFGRGICNTPSDFGRMGDVPSHPELLDWLAIWFRDDASGSLKQLHRLIVTSAAYRQSSQTKPEAATVDDENRWLWRQNRLRMDADCFRDAVLHSAGALDLSMGGPAVEHFSRSKGPQATPVLNYDDYDWAQSAAARRTIYRYVWRGIADPFMESLDFPDLGLLSPQRSYSVSSLQALALYNNDFVLTQAAKLAARIELQNRSLSSQVQSVTEAIWLRRPTDMETMLLENYAAEYGLSSVARLLFNSNEFLFVD